MNSADRRRDEQHGYVQAELTRYRAALESARAKSVVPEHVDDALSYIHTHLFEEDLSVAAVREHLGLRNHNVSCRFKHAVGLGMREYIEAARLGAARRLLLYPNLSILDIAWSVGYNYPETFARAFRRRAGCSASDFREEFFSNGDGSITDEPYLVPTINGDGQTE